MPTTPQSRFDLRLSEGASWTIADRRYPPDDSRHVVAFVDGSPHDHVEVTWFRECPLPLRFSTAEAALNALMSLDARPSRADRPHPIAHRPPISRRRLNAG